MNQDQLTQLLHSVATGATTPADAMQRLRRLPFEDQGFATVDHHRAVRCGHPEVIFCVGKSVEQVVSIAKRLVAESSRVLATRATDAQVQAMRQAFPGAIVSGTGGTILVIPSDEMPVTDLSKAHVLVVCAGTSDLPVVEEAMLTLRSMSVPAVRITDVGIAGLHRLLPHVEALQRASAIVCVAGMEAALPSVVGGLVACPVFGVPTSVGYGTHFGGVTALLGMLNSCASNVSTVNIDNGFGAAYCAALVCHQIERRLKE